MLRSVSGRRGRCLAVGRRIDDARAAHRALAVARELRIAAIAVRAEGAMIVQADDHARYGAGRLEHGDVEDVRGHHDVERFAR